MDEFANLFTRLRVNTIANELELQLTWRDCRAHVRAYYCPLSNHFLTTSSAWGKFRITEFKQRGAYSALSILKDVSLMASRTRPAIQPHHQGIHPLNILGIETEQHSQIIPRMSPQDKSISPIENTATSSWTVLERRSSSNGSRGHQQFK